MQTVMLTEIVTDWIKAGPLPKKRIDPGVPLIYLRVAGNLPCKALLDSGSGVNLISHETYQAWNLPPLKECNIRLELADQSVTIPLGQVDDVVTTINGWSYPADFLVIDVKNEDKEFPIIMGRAWLSTVDAKLNMRDLSIDISKEDKIQNMRSRKPNP